MKKHEDKTETKRRPLWVRCLRWVFFSVLGCILFIVLIWAGLQTPWAKNRLAAWIASATASTEGYQVTLEGLDGRLPFSILIDRMTLSDAKGKWLEGRRLNISLKAVPLFTGMLDVEWFRMDALSVSRLPYASSEPSEKESAPKERPPLSLPRVMVREIQIDRIDLEKEVAGAPMTYSLQSSAQTGDQQIDITASLKDLDHGDDALRLSTTYNLGTRQIATELTYHESKGGLVAGLMNLSEAQGITLDLKAHGPLSDVTGHLKLAMKGYGGANIDYQLGLDGPITVAIDAKLRAAWHRAQGCGDCNRES